MNVVLLSNGNYNQVALANKISQQNNLVGIIIEKRKSKKKKFSINILIENVLDKLLFFSIGSSWQGLMNYYKRLYPNFPKTRILNVDNINSGEAVRFIINLKPDLIVVSGTRIIKNEILNISVPKGIVNLHTGLSPYVKGGPNCTNWCIAKRKFHLIGNTVMWINAGIDTGNIITTESTNLNGFKSLTELHIRVMNHAHELYCRAIKKIENDLENCSNVSQNTIAEGRTFFTKEWNWRNKLSLLMNSRIMKKHLQSEKYKDDLRTIRTVPL